jgi:hypothetical protein
MPKPDPNPHIEAAKTLIEIAASDQMQGIPTDVVGLVLARAGIEALLAIAVELRGDHDF